MRELKRKHFALHLRVPGWTNSFTATVGKERFTGKAGEWLKIDRNWKSGNPDGAAHPSGTLEPAKPPAGWNGDQVYRMGAITLVPFADASVMRVWLPK